MEEESREWEDRRNGKCWGKERLKNVEKQYINVQGEETRRARLEEEDD